MILEHEEKQFWLSSEKPTSFVFSHFHFSFYLGAHYSTKLRIPAKGHQNE
jgi:hypothetical protein